MFALIYAWAPKLSIEFEDASPYCRYEAKDGEFTHQRYAVHIKNVHPTYRPQERVKVVLKKVWRTQHFLNLPLELRYRNRSDNRHYLNPDESVVVDVLSFEIRVGMDIKEGFFINFHGDNDFDYSMPCSNCRIQIEASSSMTRPISKCFEIGQGLRDVPTEENPNHKMLAFFMKEVAQ